MNEIQIILILILIFSVIIHEVAHGLMALKFGDNTAEMAGRLTLNPIPHIDLFGTIIVPAMFLLSGLSAFLAWAKPVPYNPRNFSDLKKGERWVAAAGPISNIILAIIFMSLIIGVNIFSPGNQYLVEIFFYGGLINLFLAIFNLIPVVPLDGSKILFSFLPFSIYEKVRYFMEKYYLVIFVILIFIIFNTNFLQNFVMGIYKNILGLFL